MNIKKSRNNYISLLSFVLIYFEKSKATRNPSGLCISVLRLAHGFTEDFPINQLPIDS